MRVDFSRPEILAGFIIENKSTIRATAEVFGYSKSLVHNDVSNKLKKINSGLYKEVKEILNKNFEEKHLRGGEATKNKYLKKFTIWNVTL